MKYITKIFPRESALQLRMTLWVVGTVTLVATLVMLFTTIFLRREYEEEVRVGLANDIEATVKIIDQRMLRVEYITMAAASIIEEIIEPPEVHKLDTILANLLQSTKCIDAVTLALATPNDTLATLYSASRNGYSQEKSVKVLPPVQENLEKDLNWNLSYHQEQEFWCAPFTPRDYPDFRLQCFSIPIHSKDDTCMGMLCTMDLEQRIEEVVNEFKTRPDLDVTIYNRFGDPIIKSNEDVAGLSSKELIVQEHNIDRLGWRIVFSVDRHVITEKLTPLIWQMTVIILILIFCMVMAISLTVKYVARPFVKKQQRIAESKAAIERELKIAAETQGLLVPHTFPAFPDRTELSLHACLHPARAVGGDLYDYFIKQNVLYFCLGDVSGKGVPASLLMAATHYLFRSVASVMPTAEAVQQMNRTLCIDNEECNFVTFFYGSLDLTTGVLEYCNAGHNPPILVHDDKAEYFAKPESMPLGIWDGADYHTHRYQFCKNDTLLLYTDGVTEAMNAEGKLFGDDDTLACVNNSRLQEPESIIDALLKQVRQHAGTTPQSDDITMLCIRFNQ